MFSETSKYLKILYVIKGLLLINKQLNSAGTHSQSFGGNKLEPSVTLKHQMDQRLKYFLKTYKNTIRKTR